jgi:chromosome segregation ATPase
MTRTIRLLLFGLAPALAGWAQPSDSSQTLSVLLQEVRQLRLVIERSSTIGPRMQLLLQRVQLQDGKVSRISRDLQDARSAATQAAGEVLRVRDLVPHQQEQIQQEQNPARRSQMEESLRQMRAGLDELVLREQQLRARESELAAQLGREQAVLDEFQTKLDRFEKSLESGALP